MEKKERREKNELANEHYLLRQEREILLARLTVIERELGLIYPLRFRRGGRELLQWWVRAFRLPVCRRISEINRILGLNVALPPLRPI